MNRKGRKHNSGSTDATQRVTLPETKQALEHFWDEARKADQKDSAEGRKQKLNTAYDRLDAALEMELEHDTR